MAARIDPILRAEIVAIVRETFFEVAQEVMEGSEEKWLKPKQVIEQFGMLSQEWLDRNGELLPREYASVIWPDGVEKSTRYGYPMHKINRMIREGKLKGLVKERKDSDGGCGGTATY